METKQFIIFSNKVMGEHGYNSATPANHGLLKRLNMLALLELVRASGRTSRAELVRRSGLSPPAVSTLVAKLVRAGLLIEEGTGESRGGRPPVLLRFNARFGYVLGADLGGTRVRVALADLNGDFLAQLEEPTRKAPPHARTVVEQIVRLSRQLVQTMGLRWRQVKGMAIGAPGITDVESGVVRHAPNLPGWRDVPLRKLLEEALRLPVHVDNDVNMAVLGEHWRGVAQGRQNVVFIAIGAGIGAGLLINGMLYRGATHAAGEVGYMLLDPKALWQEFRELGFLELRASGPALTARARREMKRPRLSDARAIFEAARQGDAAAQRVVEEAIEYLGTAVANLATVLDPEMIVLGGGVSLAGEMLLEPIRAALERTVPAKPVVVASALRDQAQLYGAVFSALQLVERQLADLVARL
ncbi:MAG: ROK family transcriptional regulator [Blastocatellia bacterium]|nr:ROK family transcriptional regulator [Blastocatellia bacterium]MCS7157891.1 ROK family transcriptional regulator [Blastocatellia bacterium]MCX7753372.1 ROK family transcriptional regulator [Blastocatellia bacterium]MDW8168031.1 ROK family transcriptional regulator [Acidobacteriota bacterium]MDW8255771.1 ROK family transcriptional regulator [Acidobacteriota bacterium]